MVIKIQTIMTEHTPKLRRGKLETFKNDYWMKDGDQQAKKISKKEWFRLYNIPETVVLAPLTKEG